MLKGKRVLIGVSGGIAAYKIPYLVRLFKKAGAEVRCILSASASSFVTPLTLATLSENEVHAELFNPQTGSWTNHVELGLWADLMVIAPATAATLSKLVSGHSDNLLLTTYLSAKCPVVVAPAMDLDMYAHASTQENLETLKKRCTYVIDAAEGELASGLVGKGRMAEPEQIFEFAQFVLAQKQGRLTDKKVLITAGPTYEALDPVRFIGNHSTGKMGIAIAAKCAQENAQVTLILGPSNEALPALPNLKVVRVQSAGEMLHETQKYWSVSDLGIFAAAVADYRPKNIEEEKIKKSGESLQIELVKNPDVLGWAGENKTPNQYLIGFALETENELEHAKSKLARKNLDLIVLNSLRDSGAGFGHDTNQVSLIAKDNKITNFELLLKSEVAENLINYVIENIS
jgi:phosphopantothenoylcysteine decarboxylase / phosphopantothenate---cysteine ligase